MARKVFYSFHYQPDNWRASTVRSIGKLEGNQPVSDNDWESVTRGGDAAIERWINDQMHGTSCLVTLIGNGTAGRKWINHEIRKAWDAGKGVVGIYIHNIKDRLGQQAGQGYNPFDQINLSNGNRLSSIVSAHNPPYSDSKDAYNYIADNIEAWVNSAIAQRS